MATISECRSRWVIYSDCVSNLLMYLGAESTISSENPLKSLRIRADFDSTMRRFESSVVFWLSKYPCRLKSAGGPSLRGAKCYRLLGSSAHCRKGTDGSVDPAEIDLLRELDRSKRRPQFRGRKTRRNLCGCR